jgi:DNA-directed RNA polymerase subunit RPC12/RpoP
MSEKPPVSPHSFTCPNCGAGLPDPDAPSITCKYCSTRILVPPEYQPKQAEERTVVISLADQSKATTSTTVSFSWILVILGISVVIGMIILVNSLLSQETTGQETAVVQQVSMASPTPVPIPTASPTPEPFARPVLQFGGEGSGAGKFMDARYISVDIEGNIYVAEYADGQVQKFDPSGKFLWLINIPQDTYGRTTIKDMAAGMDKRVYILRRPDILIYEEDGSPAGMIGGNLAIDNYDVLDIDPSNTLFALHAGQDQTSLVKMNVDGDILLRVDDLDRHVDKNYRLTSVRMAVDGLGNAHILNPWGDALYLFDSQGQFRDKLASKGTLPGQINNPINLAVGADGRIYLINNSQIQILDSSGIFLAGYDWDYSYGSPRDLTLDLEGSVYVVTSKGMVIKFQIDK